MTRTLILHTDNFDQINTFNVDVGKKYPARCSLYRDYETQGDGIYWAMQHGACVKSHYTDDDRAETQRLSRETPVRKGDTVIIDGKPYTVRVFGDYSNCAIFDPV